MIILCTVYNMHLYYDNTLYSLQYAPILWSYSVQFTICTYTMTILRRVYNLHPYYDHTLYSLQYAPILWSYSVQFTICTYTMIILCTVYNMHLYYDHTLYSFSLYTFLWHEDCPQWPKHVVVSVTNRIQRQLCFDIPHPLLNPDDIDDNPVVRIPGCEYRLIRYQKPSLKSTSQYWQYQYPTITRSQPDSAACCVLSTSKEALFCPQKQHSWALRHWEFKKQTYEAIRK